MWFECNMWLKVLKWWPPSARCYHCYWHGNAKHFNPFYGCPLVTFMLNSIITLMISMSKSARDHSRNKVKYDYDKSIWFLRDGYGHSNKRIMMASLIIYGTKIHFLEQDDLEEQLEDLLASIIGRIRLSATRSLQHTRYHTHKQLPPTFHPRNRPPPLDNAQIQMFVFSDNDPIVNRFKRSAKGRPGSRQRSKGAKGVKEARREARRRERQSRRFEVNFSMHHDKSIWNRRSKLGGAAAEESEMHLSRGLPPAVAGLKVQGLPRSLEAAGGRRGWRLAGVGGCRCSIPNHTLLKLLSEQGTRWVEENQGEKMLVQRRQEGKREFASHPVWCILPLTRSAQERGGWWGYQKFM